MKKNRKKHLVNACKSVVFLLLVALGLHLLGLLFTPKTTEWQQEHAFDTLLEKNSIEVGIVGTSSVNMGLSPLVLWEQAGITAWSHSGSFQLPPLTYLYVADLLRTQQPKVVVMGVSYLSEDYTADEARRHPFVAQAVQLRGWSAEKWEVATLLAGGEGSGYTLPGFLFPALEFHSRWAELTAEDFTRPEPGPTRGQRLSAFARPYTQPPVDRTPEFQNQRIHMNADSVEYYQKAIALCRENGVEVLLVTMPDINWQKSDSAAVQVLADRNGLQYLDFNLEPWHSQTGLDYGTDFHDEHHLNSLGSLKASRVLAEFLVTHYALADERQNPAVASAYEADLARFYELLSTGVGDVSQNEILG